MTTLVKPSISAIFNVTQPGHFLYNGFVERQVIVKGTSIYVRTTGVGNNDSDEKAELNELAARPAFAASTEAIMKEVGANPYPLRDPQLPGSPISFTGPQPSGSPSSSGKGGAGGAGPASPPPSSTPGVLTGPPGQPSPGPGINIPTINPPVLPSPNPNPYGGLTLTPVGVSGPFTFPSSGAPGLDPMPTSPPPTIVPPPQPAAPVDWSTPSS